MRTLCILFALIPVAALIMSLFPEIIGRSEAVAAGGFEYSLFLSKKWLFFGSLIISASGIIFVLTLDNLREFEGWVAILILSVLFIFSILGIALIAFYLGYRLTVRGNTLLYKLPFKKEVSAGFCDISHYKIRKGKSGDIGITIYMQSKLFIFAENTSPAFYALCKAVEMHSLHKK